MNANFSKYVAVLIVPALFFIAACSDSEQAGLTSPTLVTSSPITAEPLSVSPEFLGGSFCSGHPPFRVRLVLTLGGALQGLPRQLRFEFLDRFGGLAVPIVVPVAAGSSGFGSIPTSLPLPLPTPTPIPRTSPLPLPGASAGALGVPAGGPAALPVHVEFGCGVPAAGTLVVTVQSPGTTVTSQVRVRVGG